MSRTPRETALRQWHRLFGEGTVSGLSDAQLLERFKVRRDDAAFAALVNRHGPMVLAVCRGILRDRHDAEDAFQATFLVLARKADSLWVGESLGGWLHRVSHRIATEASRRSSRRRTFERSVALIDAGIPAHEGDHDDLLPVLHEEIDRLPPKYRAPVVLCHLEALTREEAAHRLGWPPGTVAGRLARARALLRDRLTRRGLAPVGGVIAVLAWSGVAPAALPRRLGESAVESALAFVGEGAAGAVPAFVEDLAKGVLKAMLRTKLAMLVVVLVASGLLLGAVAVAVAPARQEPVAPARQEPVAPARQEPVASATVAGTILQPNGQPAEGVQVLYSERRPGHNWSQVIAEATADAEGRFHLEVPLAEGIGPVVSDGVLWAYRPGSLVASLPVFRGTLPPGLPARLVVSPAARTAFEVHDPNGRPLAGARIEPRVLNRRFVSVPDGLAERIAVETVTDARGRAVLSAFLPEEIGTVFVAAEGFGRQQFGFGHRDVSADTKVITLLPAGRLTGRLTGEPEAIRGRPLSVAIWNRQSNPPPPPATANTSVTTDADGRFVVPEIAVGPLRISMEPDITSPWYFDNRSEGADETQPVIEAGRTTEVVLPMKRAVRVHGLVREKGTGRPIAGAGIILGFREGNAVMTDERGRFAGYAPPGQGRRLTVATVPVGYASLMYGLPDTTIPEGAAEFELPPIELSRAGSVRGVVEDEQGRPVAGAEVSASWPVDEGPHRNGRRDTTVRSDPEGRFVVEGVVAGVEVELSAEHRGLRTTQPVASRVGASELARLRLDDSRTTELAGRVVDTEGHPVAGAQVHLRAQSRYPTGQIRGDELVEFESGPILVTDDEGRFRTPRQLDVQGEYAAFASADRLRPDRTPWTSGAAQTFPDLTLTPRRSPTSLAGRVLDRQGEPIAGVAVWSSEARDIRVINDAQGRFRLDRLPGQPGFLFFRRDGFRFTGRVAVPAGDPIEMRLTRLDESPGRRLETLPPPLPDSEARALAARVLVPQVDRILKEGDTRLKSSLLGVLATIDPARTLEAINAGVFTGEVAFLADNIRSRVALHLVRDDPAEATAVLETITEPFRRAYAFTEAADELPDSDRAGKLRLIERLLLDARAIPEPANRVIVLARIAERLIDLGETDRATALLREVEPTARELPTEDRGGYARGAFAEELSQIDPEAAIKLAESVRREQSPFPDRHLINVAQELASRDPVVAERIVRGIKPSFQLSRSLPRLAHAMAAKDSDRARRLLELVDEPHDPFAHAYTLGMIALVLADSDKPAATERLREAFDDLERRAPEGPQGLNSQDAATVAATLLPVVERIDPSLVPEFFWRAASFRGLGRGSDSLVNRASHDAALALLLARFDRDAARVLYEPVAGRLDQFMTQEFSIRPVAWAGAAIDPIATADRFASLPDDSRLQTGPFLATKTDALLALASWLATPETRRWDRVTHDVLRLWVVGGEDLY